MGAGALATAGAGAGIVGGAGIASVAVGGLADITKALTAYTAQQQASGAQAVQSAQQQLSAASAQHAAAQQIQTAEEGLTTAQQQETFAQQALTLARKDAVRQLTDMRRAATESTTAEQQAKLNLEVARRALAQAPAGASALELKQLQLSAKEAQQAFRDAGIARDRAHQDANKAQRQGVGQMPQVVAAQRSLASAQKAVADASNNVKQAEYAQAQASKQAALQAKALAISQGQVGIAMKQLPASGRAAVTMITDLKDQWESLSKPASNQFFGLISDGVHELDKLLPMFARSAESSVGAVRDAFDKFLQSLNSPGFKKFIDVMTKTFAEGIGPLTKGFRNLLVILERIAIAAAPGLLKLLQGFREMTGDWLQSTSNAHKLQVEVAGVIRQFKDWLGLIGAVGQVLSALFLANDQGAKAGGNAVKQLTGTLQGWADWINTHRRQVNEFFINVLHTVEILAGALGNLAMTLAPLSSAFVPISKGILAITTALNSLKIGNVSALTGLMLAFGGVSMLGKLKSLGAVVGLGGAAAAGGEAAGAGGLLAGGSRLGGLAGKFGFAGRGAGTAIGGLRAFGAADAAMPSGLAVGGELGGGALSGAAAAAAPIAAIAIAMKGIDETGLLDAGGPVSKTPLGGLLNIPAHSMTETGNAIVDLSKSVATLNQQSQHGDLAQADIKGLTKQLRNLDAVGATTSIDQGKMIQKLLDQYGTFANAGRHMSKTQKNAWIDFATTAEQNGQITIGTLNKLTDGFDHSTRKWNNNLNEIQKATGESNKKTAKSFGDLSAHVSGAYDNMVTVSFAGMKMLVSSTNDLTGQLGVKQTINFTAKALTGKSAGTAQIPGSAGAGHVNTQQQGGLAAKVPGNIPGDKHLLTLNGVPISKVESGEGIFVGNRNMMAAAAKMNAQIPRFAKGGGVKYALPWPGGTSAFGELDRGIDVGGTGPVFAMDSGSVTKPNFNLFSNYGSATSGLVYKMDHPPKGYSPSSPYVYIYELFNPSATGRIRAGQSLGNITGGSGIEMGWATASGTPLADALGENIAARHTLPRGLPTSISLQNFIRDIQSGKHIAGGASVQKLKRILIDGPKGALRNTAQASVDKVWKAANAYIAKQAPKGGGALPGAPGAPIKGLPKSLQRYNRQYPPNGGSTMPMNKIAELAEWAGRGRVPGVTMGQVTIGESNLHPGAVSPDHGYGLWQITDPYGNGPIAQAGLHGYTSMLNPINNAQVMAIMYEANPSAALGQTWHGISGVTSSNAHYKGAMKQLGGLVMPPFGGNFAGGGVVPGPMGSPRTVVAHGGETVTAQGAKHYSITITNWKQGTGYMEEIADGAVNGQRRLGNQLSRMSRA